MACPKGGRVLIPAGNYRIKVEDDWIKDYALEEEI